MTKECKELLNNIKGRSIKAIRLYYKDDKLVADVFTSDGYLYTSFNYDAVNAPVLLNMITDETVVYDERVEKSFEELVKNTQLSNRQMFQQFEELCKQNDIDFESIKHVLEVKLGKTPAVQQLGRGIQSEEHKPVNLEFSGTPEQVMNQMENAIKEHPELKQILTSQHGMFRPLMFPFFPF